MRRIAKLILVIAMTVGIAATIVNLTSIEGHAKLAEGDGTKIYDGGSILCSGAPHNCYR